MTLQASAFVQLHPSYTEPEFLVQYSQPSGFIDLLAGSAMRVRLAEDDLLVYMKQLNIRTRMNAGTASANELVGIDLATAMISTPTYLMKTRAQYDHHDIAAGGRWALPLPEAYRKGMWQANFQLARDANLHGFQPQLGEGILNATGATATNLPPDSNGATTVQTYDNGEMAFYLSNQILQIKTRTLQLGIGKKFTILGPQRTLGLFEYNVVQLVQFQREGAGTASTAETLEKIVQANGDQVIWAYDDTLIGAGNGGADAVIISMPEVDRPDAAKINTNIFATVTPGTPVCVTQYCDMAAPREIVSPLAAGATDVVSEWRISSGWAPRGQAVTIISMPF